MAMQNVLAALAVSNLQSATTWYTKLLGRGPTDVPMKGLIEWEFPGGGWLQIYERASKAGHGSITMLKMIWLAASRFARIRTREWPCCSQIRLVPQCFTTLLRFTRG